MRINLGWHAYRYGEVLAFCSTYHDGLGALSALLSKSKNQVFFILNTHVLNYRKVKNPEANAQFTTAFAPQTLTRGLS